MNTTKLFYFFFSALIINSNMYCTSSQSTATNYSANLIVRKLPSKAPSVPPSNAPITKIPITAMPSVPPTKRPSKAPSVPPTKRPSKAPSVPPTKRPSKAPSIPQTKAPSFKPTFQPFKKVTPEIPLASSTMYPTAYLSEHPGISLSTDSRKPIIYSGSNPNVPHKPKPSASPTKV